MYEFKMAMKFTRTGFRLTCYFQRTNRMVHTVADEELTDYCDWMKHFDSRAYPLQNIAMCKMKGKGQPTILTDKWPHFSCTAIKINTPCFPSSSQWSSRLLLLSDSEEKFADFLHDSKVLQEGALIAGIDSVTNTHLDNVAKNMFPRWQKTSNYPLKLFYLSGTVEDMPTRMNVSGLDDNEYFVDKLTPDHAGLVGSYYKRINEDPTIIEKYFQHIISLYDLTAGIFKRSDPSNPIAWTLYGDLGKAIHMCIIPEHRGKGLVSVLGKFLFTQLVQQKIIPVLDHYIYGVLSETKFTKHIMHYSVDRAWRDSATGKCRWLD